MTYVWMWITIFVPSILSDHLMNFKSFKMIDVQHFLELWCMVYSISSKEYYFSKCTSKTLDDLLCFKPVQFDLSFNLLRAIRYWKINPCRIAYQFVAIHIAIMEVNWKSRFSLISSKTCSLLTYIILGTPASTATQDVLR